MKELNECQISSYEKKQKTLPESSGWVKRGKKKKSRGNEAKVKSGALGKWLVREKSRKGSWQGRKELTPIWSWGQQGARF